MAVSSVEDRSLNAAEREMVAQAQPSVVGQLPKEELNALGKRLREARDRARRIERQQRREMAGKAEPRGVSPARDNTGSEAKAEVLVAALKHVTQALRKLRTPPEPPPTQAQLSRKAADMKAAAVTTSHPDGGRTASAGMKSKVSSRPSVKSDPRETGRISQAGKVAQAKRDR